MSNSRPLKANCKGPVFWVPQSFHPEGFLQPLKVQAAYYLMHSIVTRLAYGGKESARLKKQYLENVMGRWQCDNVMSALLDKGLICRVGSYVEGERSFGYLPGEQFLEQPLRQFVPTDVQLLERLRKAHSQRKKKWKPIHHVWERWQSDLSVDIRQARWILAQIPPASNPYGMQTMMVERISQRDYRFSVDDYGRVHNSITSLHRRLRESIRIKGQAMACVDIVNSQPALLALRMSSTGGGARSVSPEDGHAKAEPNANGVSIYDRRSLGPTEGLTKYVQLVESGKLYEYLVRATGLPRENVKLSLLRDVFGKRGFYHNELERVFRDHFWGVLKYIRRFNRDDHGALLRELQRVESDLVIGGVGRRLKQGGIKGCVSLHDAVYCAQSDIELVEHAFRDEIQARGIGLKLEIVA